MCISFCRNERLFSVFYLGRFVNGTFVLELLSSSSSSSSLLLLLLLLLLLCVVDKRMDTKIEPHRARSVTGAI